MKCPRCQFKSPEGMNFCGMCGNPLTTPCLKCGHSNPVGAELCEQCNTKIVPKGSVPAYARRSPMDYTPPFLAETVLRTGNALIGERKLVTVLFADVAHFTAISEELDPEDVHDIMDGCFEILGQEVHGAGGTINQFTGDGIMALFGAPITYEDHIRSACHAALQIQMRMLEYQQTMASQYNVSFKIRIGMNTGMVVVGAIGDNLRLDYTAVGDTTNLAARLQVLAKPGEILVSDRIRRGAENYFVFDNAGPLAIKGKKKPVQAFILTKELSAESPEEDSESIKIPFIGRNKETALLKKAFEDAIKKGPNIVTVTGESGIGKSRLIRHFRKSLHEDSVVFLEGSCTPYGRSIPLFPIERIFRTYFNLSEKDSLQQVTFKMNHRLINMPQSPTLNKLLNLFPEFRKKHIDSPLMIEGAKRDLYGAVRDLLISISDFKPVIVMIDEIQWMDASTMDFIHFFLKYEGNLPLLFIFMETSGSRFRMSGLPTQHIHLKPLLQKQTLNLFFSVLGTPHFDLDIAKTMVNKIGGNPLFLVEMGKSLKRQGLIVRDGLKFKLKVPLSQIETPDSIKGVLAARLDALSPEKKHLVQLASVIGREFSLDLLKPLAQMTANLSESVKYLEREKIFEKLSSSKGSHYQFRQQLMQELAYHTLLRRERRHYHHLIGETIETLYRQNLKAKIGLLSHHFYKAQDWPKALSYTLEAAEQAGNSFASNEALTYIDRALDVLSKCRRKDTDSKRLELYQKKGETLFNLGQLESAQTIFNTILSKSRRQGDRKAEAEALFRLGWIMFYRHKPQSAQKLLIKAIHLSSKENFRETLLKATGFLGFVYAALGKLDQAGSLLIEALKLGKQLGTIDARAWSLVHLIRYYNWVGEFENALKLIRQLNALNRKIRSPYFEILMHFNQGSIFVALGNVKAAKKTLESGLKQLEEGDHKFWRPRLLNTLGWAYAESGNLQKAIKLNRKSLEESLSTGDPETIQNAQINIGENYLAMGNIDKAEVVLEKAWEQIKKQGVSYTRWRYTTRLMIAMGELYFHKDNRKKSLYFIRKALNMAQKSRAKKHRAQALLIRGKLLSETRPSQASQSFKDALDLSQKMGTRLLTERIQQAQKEL